MQVLFADLYTPYIPIPEGRGFTALFGNSKKVGKFAYFSVQEMKVKL
jgi:hypothetical protein